MFQRTLLRQARRLVATAPTPVLRQWRPLVAAARPYSTAETSKVAEDIKATEIKLEQETAINVELAKVAAELEAKAKEARDYKDKFTRAVADFRNLQDRTEREKKTARDFAIQKFAKDLIESVDNLDRALAAVPEAVRADEKNNKDLVDFYNGLKMTETILLNTLKKHGLEKINPMGDAFDPNKHEATFQVPMPGKAPNTVFDVQQTGFSLNGRTIRAAKVGITQGPQ